MKRTFNILIAVLMQISFALFAQEKNVRNASLIDYLVNPTEEERQMFQGLSLYQVDEAISMYDSKSLVDQFKQLNTEIKGLQTELSDVSQKKAMAEPRVNNLRTMILNQIQLLRMTGERKNIDRVMFMVSNLIDTNPSDLTFMKPYLDVKFQTGEWDECERVLALFEANCSDEYDFARITQNKASVANGRNQIPLAIELYTKAISMYNNYVKKEGWDYKGIATKMMMTDNFLSQLYYRVDERDSCRHYMDKVLEIGDIAIKYDTIEAPIGFASSCNSIANKLMSYGDSIKADSVYSLAYRYIEEAYQKAPFRNGSTYAFYYMNHARDKMSSDKYEEAVEDSERALEVMSQIYRVFPKWSAVNYFEALRLRAELYTLCDEPAKGYDMLKDAEAELDEIEQDSPNSNQLRYYNLYFDLGINKATSENLDESIAYFEKAKLAVKDLDPRVRDRNVALCDKYIELFTKAMTEDNKENEKIN